MPPVLVQYKQSLPAKVSGIVALCLYADSSAEIGGDKMNLKLVGILTLVIGVCSLVGGIFAMIGLPGDFGVVCVILSIILNVVGINLLSTGGAKKKQTMEKRPASSSPSQGRKRR